MLTYPELKEEVTEKNLRETRVFELLEKMKELSKELHIGDLDTIRNKVNKVEDVAYQCSKLLGEKMHEILPEVY